ncbi:MAG: hypothetical protein ACOYOU_07370, partial [Kiritimatiellia bacterium]
RREDTAGLLQRAFLDIFVTPPSLEVLRQRMTSRAENAVTEIEMRVQNAEHELRRWREYRYLVVNENLDQAYAELKGIVLAEHCRNLDVETKL